MYQRERFKSPWRVCGSKGVSISGITDSTAPHRIPRTEMADRSTSATNSNSMDTLNYGEKRPWLTCLCGRRVGKLYRGSICLACRQCAEATYESQKKSRRGRLFRKATRIRAGLDDFGRPGIDPFPARPSGMQRKIYSRLKTRAEIIEHELIKGGIYRPRPRRKLQYYARRA